jgi:hypothetical protein
MSMAVWVNGCLSNKCEIYNLKNVSLSLSGVLSWIYLQVSILRYCFHSAKQKGLEFSHRPEEEVELEASQGHEGFHPSSSWGNILHTLAF